jgi:hypothetical protein
MSYQSSQPTPRINSLGHQNSTYVQLSSTSFLPLLLAILLPPHFLLPSLTIVCLFHVWCKERSGSNFAKCMICLHLLEGCVIFGEGNYSRFGCRQPSMNSKLQSPFVVGFFYSFVFDLVKFLIVNFLNCKNLISFSIVHFNQSMAKHKEFIFSFFNFVWWRIQRLTSWAFIWLTIIRVFYYVWLQEDGA